MEKHNRRPLDRLLAPYRGSSQRIREKTRLLAIVVLLLGAAGLLLVAAMAATGAAVVAAIVFVFSGFCAAVLWLLSRGRFSLASSVFLYGLFAVMFAAIKFDQYVSLYECYVFGTLGIFLLVSAALIGSSRSQAAILTVLDLAAVAVLYLADALPLEGGKVSPLALQSLITSALMIGVAGLFSSIVIGLQISLVEKAEGSSEAARRQYEAMTRAVAEAERSTFAVGSRLAAAAAALERTARLLQGLSAGIRDGAASLDGALGSVSALTGKAAAAQEEVRASLAAYSEKVLGASASTARMIKSLEELSGAAGERRSGVAALEGLVRAGEGKVEEVGKAIGAIVADSGRLLEMNALIGDVADKINLLGMNASIEAAHAGAAGRGFAVVAGEIRGLSQETAKGTGKIKGILASIGGVVEGASSASRETDRFFRSMAEEIRMVSRTLSELLHRLDELGAGTTDASRAMGAFPELAAETGRAADATTEALGVSAERFAELQSVAGRMVGDAVRMAESCEELLSQSGILGEAGRENMRRIEELKALVTTFGVPAAAS